MPDNELSLGLSVQKDIDELKRFQQELKNTKALASEAVAAFRGGTGSAADARQAINAASQAGTGGVQGSASSGSSGGATPASVMAAASVQGRPADVAAYNLLTKQFPGMPQRYYDDAAQKLGVSIGAPASSSFNSNAAMIGIAQTAMSAASGLGNAAALAAASSAAGAGGGFGGPGAWTGHAATFAAQNANGYGSFSPAQLAFFQGQTNLAYLPTAMAATQNAIARRIAPGNFPQTQASILANQVSLGYIGVEGISGGFNLATNATRAGMTPAASPMAGMELGGRIGGSLLGLGIGILSGNPIVAAMAMMGGGEVGSSAMRYFGAPAQNATDAAFAMAPFRNSLSGMETGYKLSGSMYRLQEMQRIANESFKSGSPFRFSDALAPDMGKAASSINEGLFLGGIDPYQRAGNGRVYHPGEADFQHARDIVDGKTGTTPSLRAPFGLGYLGIGQIKEIAGVGREQVGEMYLRRIASIYGAPNVAAQSERMAPMFASLPSTGGNITDMMARFGPVAVSAFLRIQNDDLTSSVPSGDLMHNFATKQGLDRQAALASLQVIGAGGGVAEAMKAKMAEIAKMPGGAKSLDYAQTSANYRSGLSQQFGDDITAKYGMEQLGIRERLAMAQLRPYAPGAVYGEQAALIRSQRGEAGMIAQQIAQRKADGTLSVQEEYSLRARQASANIEAAQGIATIAEGGANILPGLSGGMPAGLSRFNSPMLASLMLGRYGSPRRSAGSFNGAHAAAQDAFYDGFGVSSGPYSRSGGANDFSGGRVEELLGRIVNLLEGLNGTGKGSFPSNNGGSGNTDQNGVRWQGNFN